MIYGKTKYVKMCSDFVVDSHIQDIYFNSINIKKSDITWALCKMSVTNLQNRCTAFKLLIYINDVVFQLNRRKQHEIIIGINIC